MEENSELEEGEASYYKDDEDNNVDPDIALSYIDEKIQKCLGHLQKDFEGGISAENLGAKFGGYGSFLPTQERFPSIWSRPKTPQRCVITPRSPNNLPVEGTSQSLKVPPNAPSSVRLGTASYSANELHSSGVVSGDVSVKQDSHPSVLVGQKSTLKDENLNKLGNLSDQRTLKVRIKMASDKTERKNAAIYSGLGLDNSPSSSLGNSPEEVGGILHISQKIADESPTSILQDMTSFPVPGSALISPLNESLLCLTRSKSPSSDSTHMPLLKSNQQHSALLVDESDSVMGNGKLPKENETKVLEKSEGIVKLNHNNGIKFENDTAFSVKKKLETDTPEVNAVRDRLSFPDSVEDSSESIYGQNCGKSEKKNDWGSSVENVSKPRAVTCNKDVLVDLRGSGRCKGNKTSAPSKAYSDASKCKEDLNVGSFASSKQKIAQQATFHMQDETQQATFHMQDETVIPSGKEKPLLGGKKSQGIESSIKAAVVSTKESMRVGVSAEPKTMMNGSYGVSNSRDKMNKLKSQKDINKARGNRKNSLDTKLERANHQMASWGRPSSDRAKNSSFGDLEQNASLDESKERFVGQRVDNQPMFGASVKDAAYEGPCHAENALAYEVVQPAVNHVVIQENWVCCDSCQKWRLLPYYYKPEQLPEKWLCSMQTWLSGMNRCDISEEETTKALNAAYQRTQANGIASGVTSVHVQHLEQSHQIVDFHALSSQGKKKQGFKEVAKVGSTHSLSQTLNPTNNQLQESVKSRSLNDMNQLPAGPNLINKSGVQTLVKSHNLVAEKCISKQKDNHMNGAGKSKQVKKKNKREANHYEYGTSKKAKTENVDKADKHQKLDMEPGRVGRNSTSGLSTNASEMNVQKSNNYSFSEGVKCDTKESLLVSVRNTGHQTRVSSDGGSLDIKFKTGDERDISLKKRKLLEWQDNQNGNDSNINVVEYSTGGLKKEKKPQFSKSVVKEYSTKSAHDKLNKKGRVAKILLSGRGMEEGGNIDKDEQPQKQSKKFLCQQTFDGGDLIRKDVGSGQVSMTTTSSSSKVSVSLKSRAVFDDVKGSPAESVSSSPLRASIPEKRSSVGGDVNGGLPVIGKVRRSWDGDGDGEVNQSGKAMKKVSDGFHPEPLNFVSFDYQDGDIDHKIAGKAKPSSDLLNGDAEITEHHQCFSDLLAIKNCHEEGGVDNNHSDNALFPQKSHKSSSSWSKDKDRSSNSDFNKNKMKISSPVSKQVDLSSKKTARYEPETDPKSHAPSHEGMKNFKHSIPNKSGIKSSKDEKDHVSRIDSVGQCSKDIRTENWLKLEEHDYSNAKLDALCSRNWNATLQQNLILDFGGETKTDRVQKKSRSGTLKLFSDSEGQGKQESQSHLPVMGSQQGEACDGLPVDTSGNGDVSKALKYPGNCGTKNSADVPDRRGFRDLNAPSPGRMNSAGLTATTALKEAKDLRDYADRLKSLGFGFESNEAYFQAALKFLHGASLLETSNGEGGKQGEITQMQAYSTTAKLCKGCALEYKSRHEMAAAALAYKCMEVAYWRVVYCKNSLSIRDHSELQASLQMIPQGESPSSSASDVDNLNNQAIVDKATLSKGTISHVAGNPVIVARNHSNFLRLLDFTQDVNFAVEASRKSQNAFSAANVALEEAQNREYVTSVKKVIDFSFQDVEGFVRLVHVAMKAISHSGFGGARD